MCLRNCLVLKTMMSSVAVLAVFPFLLQGVLATIFPPVNSNNRPPIPGPSVRQLDIPQNYYFPDDYQPSPQPSLVRDDEIYPQDPKVDDQRWFIPENQSGETGDYPTSSEAFERYYSNGLPAVGPVATPLPDDAYVAQQTGTSKIAPDGLPNVGSADIWVLTKGPDNQYVPERWVRVPAQKVVQVVNQDFSPKVVGDTERPIQFPPPVPDALKSAPLPPPPPPAVKSQFPPPQAPAPVAPSNIVRQIWIRAPNVADSSKIYQSQATFVDDLSSVKQVVDVPPPLTARQIFQPQFTKQIQLSPSPQQVSVISKKPAYLPFPPPPPPPVPAPAPLPVQVPPPVPAPSKGGDQIVISTGSIAAISDGPGFIIGKDGAMPPMRHIWIPTSQQTGKFISVPASGMVDAGKSISAKGALREGSPISVSDTWVLKQDGPVPRFETQKSFYPAVQGPAAAAIPNPNIVVDNNPVIQIDSPNNPALVGKNGNLPLDIWPSRNGYLDSKIISKSLPSPVYSTPSKSDTVVVGNMFPDPSVAPQKSYIPNRKVFIVPPPPPPAPVVAPAVPIIKDKPCPLPPQKFVQPPKSIIAPPVPRVVGPVKRPPFSRILRVNRYPFGSYYVLTSRLGSNIYAYPRQTAAFKQTKNGVVRVVPPNGVPLPVPARQVGVPVPAKQITVPLASKSSLIYPAAPAMSRIRYAYPWAGLMKSYPMPGRNVLPLPLVENLPSNPGTLKASSSDSGSSDISTESVPVKPASRRSRKPEPKKSEPKKSEPKEPEPKTPAKPETSSESSSEEKVVEKLQDRTSDESEEQMTEKSEETNKSTESGPGSEESVSKSTELETDFDTAESQISPVQIQKVSGFQNEEGLKYFVKPFVFGYDQRDSAGTTQHHKQISDIEGTVRGPYGFSGQGGLYRNVQYVPDQNVYSAQATSNEPSVTNHESANANFIVKNSPEALQNQGTLPEVFQISRVNFDTDTHRD